METKTVLERQVRLFEAGNLWKGGFYEGDPLDPMGASTYSVLGYMSVLHATYLACIKPYVNGDTRALEIGPGRGAWTRCLLRAKEVVCLDALSAEHNRFWEYVGNASHVRYHKVSDFSCDILPEDYFDYLFSFGCFCHISEEGSREYFRNLYRKMKRGSHGFVMIADFEKRSTAVKQFEDLAAFRSCNKKRYLPAKLLWKALYRLHPSADLQPGTTANINEPIEFAEAHPERAAGRFHYIGASRACELVADAGFSIVDPDVGTVYRDAIVHFVKN